MVGDHLGTWDTILPQAEFAYNNSVNITIGLSPFEILHGYKPRAPIDLNPMSPTHRVSESAESFALRMHELHKQINEKIQIENFSKFS